ncbi:hypothetical protein EIP86_008085 [Pleurotus ostreatoroseus]|nr:hypothetical protein EIP86_008085 [Pleurotus ostreatoroseus]
MLSLIFVLFSLTLARADFPDCVNGPLKSNLVCDPTANYIDRATALVDLFTLEELADNAVYNSSGVPRLGLPPYNWWSEGLHGIAETPRMEFSPPGSEFSSATSFPAPLLMSAAFDDELIHEVGAVISTEGRAFNNANRTGLDYYTPNINPFKDPRWGRGQETPGEDPFRIAQYAYALVTGLQGGVIPDPYVKVLATCKHFAGYDLENWEGNFRLSFNAVISIQDLAEYYTAPFQACVRDARAGAVMCSYNAVNGVPSCANSYLMEDIVRGYYGFSEWNGLITGDYDAVRDVFAEHNYTTSLVNTSAVTLEAGVDIDLGTVIYSTELPKAAEEHLVSEVQIRTSVIRLYSALVRLGYFDPPEKQPYRQLGWNNVNTPAAQSLALRAASSAIVLLKNDGLLPISKDKYHKIALIGPWANATTQMQSNYAGQAPYLISPLQGFRNAGFDVTYVQGTTINSTDTSGFSTALEAAKEADLIIYAGGIDNTIEAEAITTNVTDRLAITWPGNQLELVGELGALNKPLVVLQMGGGQVDSSSLKANASVNALLWGGYPGQNGGTALADVITGVTAPAGRLPITQYPAAYVDEIPMTDMVLRPSAYSPGRTYKWYTGTPVFDFGVGLHYTTFNLTWASSPPSSLDIGTLVAAGKKAGGHLDRAVAHTFGVTVHNTGHVTSDYVALLFRNTTAGPQPAPRKELVSYSRVKAVQPGKSATATLPVTLGELARVDEYGNKMLYPGTYRIWLDTTGDLDTEFQLVGQPTIISTFPQPR